VYAVQIAVSVLFAVVPAQHRGYLEALLLAILAAQVVASVIVASLPIASLSHPRWGGILRGLHRFGHMRFRDEPGTLKAPGSPASALSVARVDALRRAVEHLDAAVREDPAVTVNTATPPPAAQGAHTGEAAPVAAAPEHTP
jgi:hypothetical protein